MLTDVTPLIRTVSERQNLSARKTEKAFNIIAKEDKEGYFFLALLLALHTKGETSDELLGLCRSLVTSTEKIKPKVDINNITDNSGTGGDKLRTFNVSTSAAFVIAGAGVTVAKQTFFAVTGLTGSADVFLQFGIDLMGMRISSLKASLEKVGISPYLKASSSISKREGALGALMRVQIERGLKIITPLHLAANAYGPIPMRRRVYGCAWEDKLPILAELFQKLGYTKGMVVHGLDGIDEVSTIGKTKIVEFADKKTKTYTITPRDLGLKKAKYDDIKAISKERNIIDFLRIIYGKERGPRRDIVLANTAASLYVMDKVKNLADGVKMAGKIIDEGFAFKKLEALVDFLGNKNLLNQWKKKAGINY